MAHIILIRIKPECKTSTDREQKKSKGQKLCFNINIVKQLILLEIISQKSTAKKQKNKRCFDLEKNKFKLIHFPHLTPCPKPWRQKNCQH